MISKEFVLIGHPLGHSVSPEIHERLFAQSGVPGSYRLFPVSPEELPDRLEELSRLDGFNVTIPHKETLAAACASLDDSAARYRSVNTVRCTPEGMRGYNTDCDGFLRSLASRDIPIGPNACVIGVGGVGRMFATECVLHGADVTLAARPSSLEKAEELAKELRQLAPQRRISVCPLSLLGDGEEHYSLLINATPCGMFPQVNATPAGPRLLSRCDAVFDAIYNPTETLLLRLARRCGCNVVGGMGMLVYQAAVAQQIWMGSRFDPDALDALVGEMSGLIDRRFPTSDNRPVVLCGFMGCGKSSLGRAAAQKLGRAFLDADTLIAEKAGMPIPEIFSQKGEAYFRALERETAAEIAGMRNVVVASGGGMLTDERNIAVLRRESLIVYIDVSFPHCYQRIRSSSRPLVHSKSRDELEALYLERQAAYRRAADITIRNDRYFQRSLEELTRRVRHSAPTHPQDTKR